MMRDLNSYGPTPITSFTRFLLLTVLAVSIGLADAASAQHGRQPGERHSGLAEEGEVSPLPRTWAALFADAVEDQHALDRWSEHEVLHARFTWNWIDGIDMKGEFWLDTETRRLRILLDDETVLQHDGIAEDGTDGTSAWISPAEHRLPRESLILMSMPNLLTLPYRLRCTTTHLLGQGWQRINDRPYYSASLVLHRDREPARHHWYSTFVSPINYQLRLVAFLANHDPELDLDWEHQHAAQLDDYIDVDGVPLATTWTFRRWSRSRGVLGDQLGELNLRDPQFLPRDEVAFNRPEDDDLRMIPVTAPNLPPDADGDDEDSPDDEDRHIDPHADPEADSATDSETGSET
ncbi:MAG: hypothetical protein EA377_05900 [Phycisphaerales bacterium]|nr:MAG: hypothetical protein EA377_05900 [Phycisphaerales bacterium]